MEYLMTYGWAILIIAVVLGALFQLGVFNASSFSPRAPPGACQVFRPSGPGTTTNINLMGVCTGQLPQYVAQFNGQSSYIRVQNSQILNPTGSATFSFWIYPKDISTPVQVMLEKGLNAGSYAAYYIRSGWTSGQFECAFTNGARSYDFAQTFTSLGIAVNSWSLITCSIDDTSTALTAYVNGASKGTVGATINTNPQNTAALQIGYLAGGSYNYFNGILSNVQIYNISLSANQVQALYLEGIGGAPMKLQNLIGWWPLNGDTKDYSGNNNNGVPAAVTFTSQYGK